MRKELEEEIRRECDKHISRFMAKVRTAHEDQKRYQRRTGQVPLPMCNSLPDHWALDKQFNPFYVRGHLESISFAVTQKIKSRQYEPRPSVRLEIPKPGGGTRTVNIFTIVDSAVSVWLHEKLLTRNFPTFSGYSYAYRSDRTGHHAIEHLAAIMESKRRAYILEFDFKKYFDSIDPKYLLRVIDEKVKRSPREQAVIEAFLQYRFADGITGYQQALFDRSPHGFPQGTTISLFFANVACLELDRQIEETGATFARFADDTVIICNDYGVANGLARIMLDHGRRSGAGINIKKSEGISQVGGPNQTELKRPTESFIFLGHRISTTSISAAPHTIRRFKREMSTIIYNNLLLYPKRGKFNKKRIRRGIDLDLVDCINELRHSLYGDLSSEYISRALENDEPLKLSTCKLSYYALVKDGREFVRLDGWLADSLSRAYNCRRGIVETFGLTLPRIPKAALVNGTWHSDAKNRPMLVPSFTKSWRYSRKCYLAFGAKLCPPPPQYDA